MRLIKYPARLHTPPLVTARIYSSYVSESRGKRAGTQRPFRLENVGNRWTDCLVIVTDVPESVP